MRVPSQIVLHTYVISKEAKGGLTERHPAIYSPWATTHSLPTP